MSHTNYKQMIESLNEYSHCKPWELDNNKFYIDASREELKLLVKSQAIKSLNNEIEYLESKKKEVLHLCVGENCNGRLCFDLDYNKALQDHISHLQSELLLIEEDKNE